MILVIALFNSRVINTTVLIQEGHVGRIFGNIGSIHNGIEEVKWNGIVGKEVERLLKEEGIAVERIGAKIPVTNTVIAVAIHFDGAEQACATGASIGYDKRGADARGMAKRWRSAYSSFFPFKWHRDNFTKNLRDYYAYNSVNATKGFLVLELGEITCKEQTDWLEPRLKEVAATIAHFIIKELER
ncbi:N-acetylmuramoyl-L-alanine amidase [bacterium]|nr:N-acetylmuramoyl-L-alanine amidase [bacterium]